MKNVMSFGNVPIVIDLQKDLLTLVFGENLDKGEDSGERNGVGKSSIVQAIHFALFGDSIGNQIKKPNLVNKINKKNLEVELEIEDGENFYVIKRTKPTPKTTNLEFYVNDGLVEGKDEGQGEAADTQKEINRMLGMSCDMFNQAVVLSTYVEPFLRQSIPSQRKIIEELLGISQLTEKADILSEKLKTSRIAVRYEEFKIKTLEETNQKLKDNHESSMAELKRKSENWVTDITGKIARYQGLVDELSKIDINKEIETHEELNQWLEIKRSNDDIGVQKRRFSSDEQRHERLIFECQDKLEEYNTKIALVEDKKCHECGQAVHDDDSTRLRQGLLERIRQNENTIEIEANALLELIEARENLGEPVSQSERPVTYYDTLDKAYEHKGNLTELAAHLKNTEDATNSWEEQIEAQLEAPLHEIDYGLKTDLTNLRDHQEFLLKILTNKESAVRKKIVTQNMGQLNTRLGHYLDKLGLPHSVKFLPDMSVEILLMGTDYDFMSLSRGERARLSLGLTFAFRDVWESMNKSLNLFFIDEVLDEGIDPAGMESVVKTIKHMTRTQGKNIFVVSHREELISRVENVMHVVKEGGFSSIEWRGDE